MPSRDVRASHVSLARLALPLGVGFFLRLALCFAFLDSTSAGDELAYTRLGEGWNRFGVYAGSWAPGYPAFLAGLGALFDGHAVTAARFAQLLLAVWTGYWVAQCAALFGNRRSGVVAAWIFALYLPLAGFTALLFSETLFLAFLTPGLYGLLAAAREGRAACPLWRLPLAGAFVGASVLVREGAILLPLPLAAWTAFALRTKWPALLPAGTFALACAVTVLPWTVRNAHLYDRIVPVAVTAGGNAYVGWNAHDFNFDTADLGSTEGLVGPPPGELRAALRGPEPQPWRYATIPGNRVDEMNANVKRGWTFARENPEFFARSRVVEFIDLVSPLSFIVRQFRVAENLGAPLDGSLVRRWLSSIAVVLVPALMLLALLGWARAADAAALRSLVTVVVVVTCSVAMFHGLTRFRAPMVPMLVVLAALSVTGTEERKVWRSLVAVSISIGLVLAWIPSFEAVQLSLEACW